MSLFERRPKRALGRTFRLALPLLAFLAACGGGGGGGSSGPTAPPPATKGIVFTPASAAATGISLSQGTSADASTLVLEVRASSVTDLYGVAFDLHYPNTVLRYVSASAGPFLTGASLQAVETAPGTVVIGLSKLGTATGNTGSGVLLTLQLQATATGTGTFSIARNTAINSSAQTLSTLSWSAGTVSVTL